MDTFGQQSLVDGMSALRRAQEALAHNLANATSPGFKRRATFVEGETFQDILGSVQQSDPSLSSAVDWRQGDLEPTGERTHLAIEGSGFLLVETREGDRALSRGGQVSFGSDGTLQLSNGAKLLGRDGRPVIVDASYQIDISPDGRIQQPQNGTRVDLGALAVVEHGQRSELKPLGAGLYDIPGADFDAPVQIAGPDVTVRQGYLERSNVEVMSEMVRMISVQRGFEASSRALTTLGQFHESFATSFDR